MEWYTEEDEDAVVEYTVHYSEGRPAPRCSNRDSPAFYDCGDPEEIEIIPEVDEKWADKCGMIDSIRDQACSELEYDGNDY